MRKMGMVMGLQFQTDQRAHIECRYVLRACKALTDHFGIFIDEACHPAFSFDFLR
jgi:hypothetical protein